MPGSTALRIATCNLQTGIGTTRGYWQYLTTGWKYRYPHGSAPVRDAARFVRDERIDLVALSEVGGGGRRTRGVDQGALLAEAAGLEGYVFFPALVTDRVFQGNAVCARFPVRAVANHALPGLGEPRFLSEAGVALGGVDTRVFVTHLSLDLGQRGKQIDTIAEIVGACDVPTLLAGDFNVSREEELDLLGQSALQKAASAPTFPSWRPRKRLDHLFFSSHFEIARVYAFDAYRFSDHLPLVAEVRLAT